MGKVDMDKVDMDKDGMDKVDMDKDVTTEKHVPVQHHCHNLC